MCLLLQLLELRRHPCAPYDVAFRVVKPGFRIDREPQWEVLVDPFLATQLVGPLAVRPYRRLIRCLKVSGIILVWLFLEVAKASSAHVGLFRKSASGCQSGRNRILLDLCPKGYPISYGTQRHFRLDKGFGRRTAKRTQIVGKTPFFGMKKRASGIIRKPYWRRIRDSNS